MSVPFRAPVTVGVKVTLIVQLELEDKVAGQLFVWVKAPADLDVAHVQGLFPVFARVTVCTGLDVPRGLTSKRQACRSKRNHWTETGATQIDDVRRSRGIIPNHGLIRCGFPPLWA